jgi:hypothetical protein
MLSVFHPKKEIILLAFQHNYLPTEGKTTSNNHIFKNLLKISKCFWSKSDEGH